MKVLVVVDMQNDFVTGPLGTKEAGEILPNVVQKMQSFDGMIFATRDTHGEDYPDTLEGKNLPVSHCIKGTSGWALCREGERRETQFRRISDILTQLSQGGEQDA